MTSARADRPGPTPEFCGGSLASEPCSQAPLADPVAEARRLIDAARAQGVTVRALGGVAVHMQAPRDQPLLPRRLKDIDLVTARGEGTPARRVLEGLDYAGDEMFNALRGSRRQLYFDLVNGRQLDLFVGEFSMCHALPIADRLDRHPYTVPLAELLLTKLQIVQLNERDERDIYSLCYHHEVKAGAHSGIETDVVADLCARDWGLWRTCKSTIERCCADIDRYEIEPHALDLISTRLRQLWQQIEDTAKTGKWKRRNRIGDRMRWYEQPEET